VPVGQVAQAWTAGVGAFGEGPADRFADRDAAEGEVVRSGTTGPCSTANGNPVRLVVSLDDDVNDIGATNSGIQ
jgi:hypothetical protein